MEIFGNISAWLLLAILLSTTMAFTALYLALRSRQSALDAENAKISIQRDYFERSVNELSRRVIDNEDRWKEFNHLILDSLNAQSRRRGQDFRENSFSPDDFLESLGIKKTDISVKRDQAFVLIPFSKIHDGKFAAIKRACEQIGLKVRRGDEEYISGNILPYIIARILESRIIIAVLDGRNPNVFYELGIAQAVGKPVVMLSKISSNVTFDLRQQQLFLYRDFEDLEKNLASYIGKMLVNLNSTSL